MAELPHTRQDFMTIPSVSYNARIIISIMIGFDENGFSED